MADDERTAKRKRSVSPNEPARNAMEKLAETRAGGTYVPPARLRALMDDAARADPSSATFQRMNWEALRKSITGLVNKVAADNIKHIVLDLFAGANLIRGRGLFCRSIMHAQELSLHFTPVFAALAAIINTKLPFVGELLVHRLVSQFRRSFRRNDKPKCHATLQFLAHLVNQRVVHELLALEILVLLLEHPTDDSVELAVAFTREVGAFLTEEAPKASHTVFDRFRAVLYEGSISVRVQYMIEVLAQTRKDQFRDHPRIPEQLDLVEEEDQITHQVGLDDELQLHEGLNVFKVDPDFVANEDMYRRMKAEILGENEEDEEEEEEAEHDDDEEEIPLDSLPSSASLSEQALASRHNRIRINNTEAMQRVYEDMRLDGPSTSGKMPWIETMSLVYEHATADEVPDAQNDLDRELSFYRQSLAAAIRGRELVLAAKVSFSRPNDYFAEMVKTDEHMERVRQRLLDESASIKASEDAKRQRELKKYGKKIQTEKLFERQRSKRDMQEKVNALKRKRQTGLDMDDDEFDVQLEEALGERKASQRTQRGPNKKRQYRDEKYGFGGKKRHNKSNTAESTDQVGPSRRKPGQRPKGGKAKRPGKARRAARR